MLALLLSESSLCRTVSRPRVNNSLSQPLCVRTITHEPGNIAGKQIKLLLLYWWNLIWLNRCIHRYQSCELAKLIPANKNLVGIRSFRWQKSEIICSVCAYACILSLGTSRRKVSISAKALALLRPVGGRQNTIYIGTDSTQYGAQDKSCDLSDTLGTSNVYSFDTFTSDMMLNYCLYHVFNLLHSLITWFHDAATPPLIGCP